jgi:hypothetical protein
MKIKFLLGSEEASCAKLSRRSVHCSELSTVKIADWETADVSGSRWASFRGDQPELFPFYDHPTLVLLSEHPLDATLSSIHRSLLLRWLLRMS